MNDSENEREHVDLNVVAREDLPELFGRIFSIKETAIFKRITK